MGREVRTRSPVTSHQSHVKRELCRYADLFYRREWMFGTSGNLSIKVSDRPLTLAITPSSVDKGALTPQDILLVTRHGAVKDGRSGLPRMFRVVKQRARGLRPSAETAIHVALYDAFPDCGAVFHVHTVHSTLVATMLARRGVIALDGLEMLKGFETLAPGAPPQIPVFPNIDDLDEFAKRVAQQKARLALVPGFLIAHHGMSAWGRTAADAEKHVELLEFLCRYLWEASKTADRERVDR